MKKILSANLAGKILIALFIVLLIMHALILLGVLPSSIIWGGQIKEDQSNLLGLEAVAITLSFLFIGLTTLKIRQINSGGKKLLVNLGSWLVFAYLVMNILGNFASGVSLETLIFGPLTIVMALCALRIALEK